MGKRFVNWLHLGKMSAVIFGLFIALSINAALSTNASESSPASEGSTPESAESTPISRSKKAIDFDDQVVESYRLTSAGDVEVVGKRDLRKNPYLFRKKLHFRPDTAGSLQEVGYAQ